MTDQEAGAPDATAPVQPPLGFSGIVASAARVYRACLRQVFLPFVLSGLFVLLTLVLFALDIAENLSLPLAYVLVIVLPGLLFSLVVALTTLVFDGYIRGERVGVANAIRQLRSRRKDLFFSGFVAATMSLTFYALLPPMWFLFMVLFYGPPILIQVIALEDLGIQDAWARTKMLMKGQWGRVVMALVTIALAIGLIDSTIRGLAVELLGDVNRATALISVLLLQMLSAGFLYSYFAAACYVAYYDAEARFEEASDAAG